MKPKTLTSDCLVAAVLLLALFGLALMPAVAHAETAAEKVYHLAPPKIHSASNEGGRSTGQPNNPKSHPQASPKKHGAAPPVTDEEKTPPSESVSVTSKHERHTETAAKDGGDHHSGSKGEPRNDVTPTATGAGRGRFVRAAPRSIEPINTTRGGSSSPVLPILIAMAALATLSIGAAVYRQRGAGDKPIS